MEICETKEFEDDTKKYHVDIPVVCLMNKPALKGKMLSLLGNGNIFRIIMTRGVKT